jgi:hypothetical protein
MKTTTIKPSAYGAEGDVFFGENWFDPLEAAVRTRVRGFIENLLEANSTPHWRANAMRDLRSLKRRPPQKRLGRLATGMAIGSAS